MELCLTDNVDYFYSGCCKKLSYKSGLCFMSDCVTPNHNTFKMGLAEYFLNYVIKSFKLAKNFGQKTKNTHAIGIPNDGAGS